MLVARLLLRLVAVLGPLAVVGWELAALPSLGPRQDWGLAVLFLMGPVVLGFLIVVTPQAFVTIARHPDLLVPLGVTTALGGAAGALVSLSELAPLATPLWSGSFPGLSLDLSASVLFAILLAVVHAGWTTSLLLQAVGRGRVDLLAPLANPGRWLPRTLAALSVGVAGLMLLLVVGLAVAAAALPLGMILIAAGSLFWNLGTAALLPATLRSPGPLSRALAEGFRESMDGMNRWWGVVVLHLILLGWLTVIHLSYSHSEAGRTTHQETTSWNVNGFWTGGYEAGCRWYEQVVKAGQTQTLAPVVTLLGLLFGVVALAVKLTVARRMSGPTEAVDDLDADTVQAAPGRVSPVALIVGASVAAGFVFATCGGLFFQKELADELFVRAFRRAAVRGESPDFLAAQLGGRQSGWQLAERLCADPDPRVRRALIGYLVAEATPAQKQERRFGAYSESWSGFHPQLVPALEQLLNDPDAEVRQEAIRAVGGRHAAAEFREPLLGLLRSGEVGDRVAVAESLAHWEGDAFLETFGDRKQPKEVRHALLRGVERYGWARVAKAQEFPTTMEKCLDDPDSQVQGVAIDALRLTEYGPRIWLGVLRNPASGNRLIAFRTWVDALVSEPIYPGDHYPVLESTENLLFVFGSLVEKPGPRGLGSNDLDGERIALVLHVVCAAARASTAQLDRTAPASLQAALQERARGGGPALEVFQQELHRLQLILRALAAVRRMATDRRSGRALVAVTMPDEAAPVPPRTLRDFLLADVKEPLAWCRRHGDGYASPFLRVNGFWFGFDDQGPPSEQSRTLGQVLEWLHLHTDEALAQDIKGQGGR